MALFVIEAADCRGQHKENKAHNERTLRIRNIGDRRASRVEKKKGNKEMINQPITQPDQASGFIDGGSGSCADKTHAHALTMFTQR